MPLNVRILSAIGRKALELVPRLSLIVSASGICLMVALIIAEIISTKLFSYSLPYALEYSEYLIPIIVFWGAAYTLSVEGHVRADIFLHRLSESAREWFVLAGYVVGLVYLVVIFKHTLDVALLSIKGNRYSYYPTPSPIGPPQLFATMGIALFILQLAIEIGRKGWRLYRRYRPVSEG
jgi:TRAP-type C4-dicarboxylate transport system permease small subunit